jgi:methylmalonyl-CoA mutase
MEKSLDKTTSTGSQRLASFEPKFLAEYKSKNQIRIVTATSLFDGHDASINIMRRLLQQRGVEVIHLGHNRTAREVAQAAIDEDVQAIAVSSYQGGHIEYFKYLRKLLDEQGGDDIRIFGGGGGVIIPAEILELEKSGVTKIYSPEDGQKFGLDGSIGHILVESDFAFTDFMGRESFDRARLSRALTLVENGHKTAEDILAKLPKTNQRYSNIPVLGITGTGGAGKSSLLDELLLRFMFDFPSIKIGVVCVDPSKKKTGGSLLGDRIRINSCSDMRIYSRSFASRESGKEISRHVGEALKILRSQDYDFIVVETSGIGQGDTGILNVADISLYVMTPEYGASSQLEKIDMLDFADFICVNKYERPQGPDAVRDIRTTLRRSRFKGVAQRDEDYGVFGTIASRFDDDGTNGLYRAIALKLSSLVKDRDYTPAKNRVYSLYSNKRDSLIPSDRQNYLAQIAKTVRGYHQTCEGIIKTIGQAEALDAASQAIEENPGQWRALASRLWEKVEPSLRHDLHHWDEIRKDYSQDVYVYQVRNRDVSVSARFETLANSKLPRVALPKFRSKIDLAHFLLRENRPGFFPYTAGIFPFRRRGEDPKRQFAGEGGPARTNKRFHFLCKDDDAKRLSTAFDSVTLYGADPDQRPDIFGKVGESGVSIATLDDMKVLYQEFDLCAPNTSVSMTINGPAPIILAMFLNTAIDQQLVQFVHEKGRQATPEEYSKIYDQTLQTVRGTVQADILKEDQAQNTCIFSTEFALKLMGDMQQYFISKKIQNYYAVSISGYHIAEAGANPITQLAFTLANGFTYVEYYLARGMAIDDFAPNLSFFFSNGLDAEYAVLGRVARRIWAIAMRDWYRGNERSQKLKYHIQTSGRSLHAQEMNFNDIRTTLQALLALYDNCNSLHTNAYDEAITTPTEESVRRAMAIQMIINREFGPNQCENINQGSYFIDDLTDLVEEAVVSEFERISSRGGVLGAMETQYQRNKIQEESLTYEHLKHTGALPIIGVNTYVNPEEEANQNRHDMTLSRASYDEKNDQLTRLKHFQDTHAPSRDQALNQLAQTVFDDGNVFAELMNTVRYCSLGDISECLYRVGGRYRRSM